MMGIVRIDRMMSVGIILVVILLLLLLFKEFFCGLLIELFLFVWVFFGMK